MQPRCCSLSAQPMPCVLLATLKVMLEHWQPTGRWCQQCRWPLCQLHTPSYRNPSPLANPCLLSAADHCEGHAGGRVAGVVGGAVGDSGGSPAGRPGTGHPGPGGSRLHAHICTGRAGLPRAAGVHHTVPRWATAPRQATVPRQAVVLGAGHGAWGRRLFQGRPLCWGQAAVMRCTQLGTASASSAKLRRCRWQTHDLSCDECCIGRAGLHRAAGLHHPSQHQPRRWNTAYSKLLLGTASALPAKLGCCWWRHSLEPVTALAGWAA